jgi:hypothetical protein
MTIRATRVAARRYRTNPAGGYAHAVGDPNRPARLNEPGRLLTGWRRRATLEVF